MTLIVQLPLAATVALETDREPEPAVAVMVGEPHPEEEALAGLATVIAPGVVGNVSVKFKPLTTTEEEFVRVKVSDETPPALVEAGLKAFEIFTADVGSVIYAYRVETPTSEL